MATSAAVQGAGLLTGVWKKIEKAIYDAGGTDEHLARLAKDEANLAFANFAAEIVRTIKIAIASFLDQIRAGNYDFLYGFAEKPDEIKGQAFHLVTNQTELGHPGVRLTTKQVWEKYGDKMASLSELLDYGIKNPDVQREFPIGIVWKDGDQFWYACLYGYRSLRGLFVRRARPVFEWGVNDRFLLRK